MEILHTGSSTIPLGDIWGHHKGTGKKCLENWGLREEHLRCWSYTVMPFAETPQHLKPPHAYTFGPFCISVSATSIDGSDSERNAYSIRPNIIGFWRWCQAPKPNTRGELALSRNIYVISGDAWGYRKHLRKTMNSRHPCALSKSVL